MRTAPFLTYILHRGIGTGNTIPITRSTAVSTRSYVCSAPRLKMSPCSHDDTSSAPKKTKPNTGVGESVIRLMTRLAMKHGAVNLSQGFPNEPPPLSVRLALARAVLTGVAAENGDDALSDILNALHNAADPGEEAEQTTFDELNQYSPPMGRPDLRQAIAAHYKQIYDYDVDSDQGVTVTLGATEAVASAIRTCARPGDKAVIFEPYHELYPSQARIFYVDPVFVTLREDDGGGGWSFEPDELEEALSGAKLLLLNTPHNPTGKVFTNDELNLITALCVKHDVYIITDEIYEHMTYGSHRGKHIVIPKAFPKVADRTLVCNSVGKSASATGWRLGWCLMPHHLTPTYRGVHDQLVVMSPHPIQYAALTYFELPESYFSETLATRYLGRLNRLRSSLEKAGFQVQAPEGAYYLFARYRGVSQLSGLEPWDAAMYMVKEVQVACVPGTNFYGSESAKAKEAQMYLRFAACRSDQDIDAACKRLDSSLSAS